MPANFVTIITSAINTVPQPATTRRTSIIIPTPSRNSGTKMVLPTKLIRPISGERLGTQRLSATPQRNAPSMPSSPAQSANPALTTSINITIAKPAAVFCLWRKNHLAISGKKPKVTTASSAVLPASVHQYSQPSPASSLLFSTASTSSDKVMASIVAPIVMFTAADCWMP